jgi:large subunit ribosomal protein L29
VSTASTETTAASSGGSNDLAGELRELHDDELQTRLGEAKEELFNLRFQTATGQLDNNRRLRTVRHDIARIYTILRERELGLSVAPNEGEVV